MKVLIAIFFIILSFAGAEAKNDIKVLLLQATGSPIVFSYLLGDRDKFDQRIINWEKDISNLTFNEIETSLNRFNIEVRGNIEDAPISWKMIVIAANAFNPEKLNQKKLSIRVDSKNLEDFAGVCIGNSCLYNKNELEKFTFSPEYLDGTSLHTIPGIKGLHLAIHELAHTFQPFHSLDRESLPHKAWSDALLNSQTISNYGARNINESFAEAVTAAILDPFFACYAPSLAKIILNNEILAPDFSSRLERFVGNCDNPIFREIVEVRRTMFQ
jgi:hypothetical protein